MTAVPMICAAAAAAVFLAPPAYGATIERDDVDSADVFFLAGAGEANRLVVQADANGVRFTDSGAVLTTRTCTAVHAHEVLCQGVTDTLIVETEDGDDSIDASAAAIAFAVGGPGNDTIVAARGSGGPGDDMLRGIDSGARLAGGLGNDTIVGGAGRDVLAGGSGLCGTCVALVGQDDDVIHGGAGDDVLQIEGGRDRIDGETGDDTYVVGTTATGIAATIADSGRDTGDAIELACANVRLTATVGPRERRGRYTLPGGTVDFAGLDGVLPCASVLKAVPRVAGLPLARARAVLIRAGFKVGRVTFKRSASVRRGAVIAQRPVSRTRARLGSAVALVVSSGRR